MWKKLMACALALALVHLTVLAEPMLANENPDKAARKVQKEVEKLGVGSFVAVEARDGERSQGRLEEWGSERFTLKTGEAERESFAYSAVKKAKRLKFDKYRTEGDPDVFLVRQAVETLGVGKHVMVRRDAGIIRGHIQAIEADSFSVRLDKTHEIEPVRYTDVLQVQENSDTALVILGLAVGFILGWLFIKHN